MKPIWQRLIRFEGQDGKIYYGEPVADLSVDVGLQLASGPLQARIIEGDPLSPTAKLTSRTIAVRKILSPLAPEQIKTIRCLGLNYAEPKEAKSMKPKIPILFFKPTTCITGHFNCIEVPTIVQDQSDFECELVVVIGKPCKDVEIKDALDYVIGYTICNDMTAKKHQMATSQWGMGKSFDGWLPLGPCIVSSSLVPDPQNVSLKTIVNKESFQDDTTKKHLFGVAETIAQLSSGSTLEPGSIICTGSPAGVGSSRKPPVFLKDGDVIVMHGGNGIGTLINRVKFTKGTLVSKL